MKQTASIKEKYIWNTLGGLCSSLMSIILLLIVNRSMGSELGGIFAFAYSHSQLMYTIGVFEVRPLQCTDVEEKFKFNTYFSFRLLTCIAMMVLSVGYIFVKGYTGTSAYVVFLLCLYKMTEAFTDLYSAYFQQMDRIDYSGKTIAARTMAASVSFLVLLVTTRNLSVAVASMTVVSIILFVVYDLRIWKEMGNNRASIVGIDIKELAIASFPLFLSTFIMMYINNAPKYAIENYCDNLIQNKYNILFMPAFVINMFSVFVFRPMLTSMTEKWNAGEVKKFVMDIVKVLAIILGLTLVCLLGSAVLGIPVLSAVYAVDLDGDLPALLLVMVYGGMNAILVFLYYVITVTRKQKYLIIGYLIGFLISLIAAPLLVKNFGIIGAVTSAILALGALDVILVVVLGLIIYKGGEKVEG